MVRPIIKNVLFLGQKSEEATEHDKQIITDLRDTLAAHRDSCVGMAANMKSLVRNWGCKRKERGYPGLDRACRSFHQLRVLYSLLQAAIHSKQYRRLHPDCFSRFGNGLD